MPTLDWIGKDKVVNHHQEVPYRVLEHKYGFTEKGEQQAETNSGNKIIHGDNLEALKSLLPEYEGKIKCIYIDPPYNTGNEKWVYNDNVNHPKIKKWLGEVVGKDGEDFTRHDKWLCMMYPRLKLLHKLLADDGVIFISIDDYEQTNLKLLLNEIFGLKNFVTNFIWERKKKPAFLSKQVGSITEYVVCFSKNYNNLGAFTSSKFKTTKGKKYPFNNAGNGIKTLVFPPKSVKFGYKNKIVTAQDMSGGNIVTKLLNDITIKNGYNVNEFKLEGEWRYSQTKLDEIVENNEEIVISKIPFRPNHIKTGGEEKKIHNFLSYRTYEIETNEDASAELVNIFNAKMFDFPKPKNLIEFLVEASVSKDAIVLDSFAGSGTTAHAILNLNKQDNGNRKFILVEMEDYANTITAERVKRVIKGYGEEKKEVEATGGEFDFYELGKPVFKKDDNLNEEVGEHQIRNYIYYTETKTKLERKQSKNGKYLLDNFNETGYYFYYEKNKLTTLEIDTLNIVIEPQEQYIIYADICLLDPEYMQKKNIIFKKIPRDITRF
ncbi:adenine-specific DNA-methyltransferase [Polaribacter sp. Hel1_33_96]|jgi:adenine-specific DNA-methyltransferase|uniref:site-specific DNA-methyltransferase n=1 Tax=Polaribacter sp. Hel1_33_96 TaxID=1336805 RepID=UPI000C7023A9|nr:site-specific DNA-methyltransferase [Polaribacter sp. Hel1_33_96]PKV64482.1 adenine-specific DNA-methyltransferase [Polaribacter sp. Hel1_33_96]